MKVVIASYDPGWPVQFLAERARLRHLLAPWLSEDIRHIGSTSVPDLAAKPTLDMLAGVGSLDLAAAAIPVLTSHSYVHAQHRPDALHFYKLSASDPARRTHNLHLTEPGSDLWRERIAFRDALRADPALASRYQQLKIELAAAGLDQDAYTAGKRHFVAEVLAGVGIMLRSWRLGDRQASPECDGPGL